MGGPGSGKKVSNITIAGTPAPVAPAVEVLPGVNDEGVIWHPHARCCWCGQPFGQIDHLWVCPTDACVARQEAWGIQLALPEGLKWVFLPTPRQVEFLEAQLLYVRTLYGGAAAGAKSHILRWGLYYFSMRVPKLSSIIVRANYTDLEETHLRHMERDAALFGAKYNKSERRMTFPQTGASIKGGHMDDKEAKTGYLSREYDIIVPDELVTYDEDDMIELFSRARTSNPKVMEILGGPKVWAASNPGPRGSLWVRDFFITKIVDTDKYPKYMPSWHTFVQAKVDDNPYIDLTYRANLDQMPEPRRSQLLEGDWSVFEGAFFAFHSLKDGQPWHVRTRFIPPGTDWIAGMDWGYNQPYCVLFAALLPDGHLHVAHELKGQKTDPEIVAEKMATLIRQIKGTGRLRYIAADPAMWNKTGQDHGKAIVESFRAAPHHLPMRKGDNTRGKNGWQNLHNQLAVAPDGSPWLTISPECRYFVRTLPIQEQSDHDADDVDTTGDDHAVDAARYLCNSRPSPTRHVEDTTPKKGSVAHDLAQLRRMAARG